MSLTIYSTTLVSFSNSSKNSQNNPGQFIVNKPLDSAWNKLQYFLFLENLIISNQFKIEGNASARIDLKNGKITYRDKKTNLLNDSTAYTIADVKQRSGNFNYIYPKAGNFQCLITLTKISNDQTGFLIKFDETCLLTEYVENAYVERRRRKPNFPIESTGFLERKLKAFIE